MSAQQNITIEIGQSHKVFSNVLNETRDYWVSLPDSYSEGSYKNKRYPVLFILDVATHFKVVSAIVDFMSTGNTDKREIPEMIVVGVLSTDRFRDFTPKKIKTRRENNSGGGDLFLHFLETELLPTIDKNYRTQPTRMLIGHSLGGLLTTHAYMQQHSVFNSFIAVDPSFGTWDATTIDAKIKAISPKVFKRPLFLATANWQKRNLNNRDRHVRFVAALDRAYNGTLPVAQRYFENKNHSNVALPAIYEGLSFIYKGYHYAYRDATTLEHLKTQYEQLSARLSYTIKPPEDLVNRIAYRFLYSSDSIVVKKALGFFELNVKNHSNLYNAYDSLGEAFAKLEDTNNAIKNFEKSLLLNPKNENAKKMLKAMKKEEN